jgi:hypothetical protein
MGLVDMVTMAIEGWSMKGIKGVCFSVVVLCVAFSVGTELFVYVRSRARATVGVCCLVR